MVTIDEASHCPKCGTVGKIANERAERHFIDHEWWDVYAYFCVNENCRWFNTGWAVSSNERGVVYERPQGPRGQDKTFKSMSPDQLAYGRRILEEIVQEDLRDKEQ